MSSHQGVEDVIADLARRPPATGSFEAAYEFADDHPELVVDLVVVGLRGLPKGTPFLDDMIHRAPDETLGTVAADAVRAFTADQTNEAAESAIEQVALQDPKSLRPFLQALWPVSASIRSYSRDWPWRGADGTEIDRLRNVLADSRQSKDWERAWRCLLESRSAAGWSAAASLVDRVGDQLRGARFSEGGRDAAWISACFALVGAELVETEVMPIVFPRALHMSIPEEGLAKVTQRWLLRRDPTWAAADQTLPSARMAGPSDASCVACGSTMRRLVLLDPVPSQIPVHSRRRIDLGYCFTCVGGWGPSWYRHDSQGRPTMLSKPHENPIQFELDEVRPEVVIGFHDSGDRWQRQDCGASNSRENLNRLGGEFTWIQNPEPLSCPICGRTMNALLQLDWGHLIWGEGISYVQWCDACAVSGLTFQQT